MNIKFSALLTVGILIGCSTPHYEVIRADLKKGDEAMAERRFAAAEGHYLKALDFADNNLGVKGQNNDDSRAKGRAKLAHAIAAQGRCVEGARHMAVAAQLELTRLSPFDPKERLLFIDQFRSDADPHVNAFPCSAADKAEYLRLADRAVERYLPQSAGATAQHQQLVNEMWERRSQAIAERENSNAALLEAAKAIAAAKQGGASIGGSTASPGINAGSRAASAESCRCGSDYVQCLAREARRTGTRYQVSADGRNIVYLRPDGSWSAKRGLNSDGTCGGVVN